MLRERINFGIDRLLEFGRKIWCDGACCGLRGQHQDVIDCGLVLDFVRPLKNALPALSLIMNRNAESLHEVIDGSFFALAGPHCLDLSSLS